MITMSPVATLENMVSNNQEVIMLVNARMLHDFLGIKKDFSNWIKYMFSYGFENNVDYFEFTPKLAKTSSIGGRPRKDYALSIDMAKEVCMIQRSDKVRAGYVVSKVWSKKNLTGMTLRWTLEGVQAVKEDMEYYGYENY